MLHNGYVQKACKSASLSGTVLFQTKEAQPISTDFSSLISILYVGLFSRPCYSAMPNFPTKTSLSMPHSLLSSLYWLPTIAGSDYLHWVSMPSKIWPHFTSWVLNTLQNGLPSLVLLILTIVLLPKHTAPSLPFQIHLSCCVNVYICLSFFHSGPRLEKSDYNHARPKSLCSTIKSTT